MTTLDVTVLFWEGPIARAYLVAMKNAGYRPHRIVHVVPRRHPVSDVRIFPWLPKPWRTAAAERISFAAFHHWPRHIAAHHEGYLGSIVDGLKPLRWTAQMLEEIRSPFALSHYANAVDRVFADDINASDVASALNGEEEGSVVLFTGGGMLKRPLAANPHLKFLHFHPAVLPGIRGADGALWSMLIRRSFGVSALYLVQSIDFGPVLQTSEFPDVRFAASPHRPADVQLLYRGLFSFVDPVIRAAGLLRLLGQPRNAWQPKVQRSEEGAIYHFMHRMMRDRLLNRIFPEK